MSLFLFNKKFIQKIQLHFFTFSIRTFPRDRPGELCRKLFRYSQSKRILTYGLKIVKFCIIGGFFYAFIFPNQGHISAKAAST